jgi:hypothetical protein
MDIQDKLDNLLGKSVVESTEMPEDYCAKIASVLVSKYPKPTHISYMDSMGRFILFSDDAKINDIRHWLNQTKFRQTSGRTYSASMPHDIIATITIGNFGHCRLEIEITAHRNVNESLSVDDAMNSFSKWPKSGYFLLPLNPLPAPFDRDEKNRIADHLKAIHYHLPVKSFNPDHLHSYQRKVDPVAMEELISQGPPSKVRYNLSGSDEAIVIRIDSKDYIWEGNHRALWCKFYHEPFKALYLEWS